VTATTLSRYADAIERVPWLLLFVPLVISTGGNSGSQSATLIITAMSTGNIKHSDWLRVVRREIMTGMLLGSLLGSIGYLIALQFAPGFRDATIIPLTVLMVVTCGTLVGSLLPMLFSRLGLDPAIMSNPFVSGLVDIFGIVIYMEIAINLLHLVALPS
jgi:magnesium transporter